MEVNIFKLIANKSKEKTIFVQTLEISCFAKDEPRPIDNFDKQIDR